MTLYLRYNTVNGNLDIVNCEEFRVCSKNSIFNVIRWELEILECVMNRPNEKGNAKEAT